MNYMFLELHQLYCLCSFSAQQTRPGFQIAFIVPQSTDKVYDDRTCSASDGHATLWRNSVTKLASLRDLFTKHRWAFLEKYAYMFILCVYLIFDFRLRVSGFAKGFADAFAEGFATTECMTRRRLCFTPPLQRRSLGLNFGDAFFSNHICSESSFLPPLSVSRLSVVISRFDPAAAPGTPSFNFWSAHK